MPKIAYEANTMRDQNLSIALAAAGIAEEYAAAGYGLTLRQLYYQFVARGHTSDWATGVNTERSYKRLGSIVDKARMCGLLDWNHIDDRTRGSRANSHWDTPADIISSAAYGYALDKWEGQPRRLEVWVEKEALSGIVAQVAGARDVPYTACRGYMSSSALWRGARRIGRTLARGTDFTVLHLGDHDPSGIDMTRDNEERLRKIISHDYGYRAAAGLEFVRIALTMDQVEQYNAPPNPAKLTDSRSGDYVAAYGESSWELDALPPDALVDLINSEIDSRMDQELFDSRRDLQESQREQLQTTARNWTQVAEFVEENLS